MIRKNILLLVFATALAVPIPQTRASHWSVPSFLPRELSYGKGTLLYTGILFIGGCMGYFLRGYYSLYNRAEITKRVRVSRKVETTNERPCETIGKVLNPNGIKFTNEEWLVNNRAQAEMIRRKDEEIGKLRPKVQKYEALQQALGPVVEEFLSLEHSLDGRSKARRGFLGSQIITILQKEFWK